jgi:hypothetical protein
VCRPGTVSDGSGNNSHELPRETPVQQHAAATAQDIPPTPLKSPPESSKCRPNESEDELCLGFEDGHTKKLKETAKRITPPRSQKRSCKGSSSQRQTPIERHYARKRYLTRSLKKTSSKLGQMEVVLEKINTYTKGELTNSRCATNSEDEDRILGLGRPANRRNGKTHQYGNGRATRSR